MSRSTVSSINPGGPSFTSSPPALRTPTATQTRCSSFLPIPTPSKTAFPVNLPPRTVAASLSQSSLSLVYERSKLKPINTNNSSNATTSPPSVSHAKPRENSARNSRLTSPLVSPQNSLNSTPNNSSQKATHLRASLGATRKPAEELATDGQISSSKDVISPVPVPHSLRRIPRLPRQHALNTNRTHLLSTASIFTPEPPPTTRRSARSTATASQLIHPQPNQSNVRGLTPPHQARKAKSQQEFVPKPRTSKSKVFSAQFTTPVKQSSTHSESNSTSPESLQSKITLTDGDSSIRTRFDFAHKPNSTGFSQFDSIRKMPSSNSSHVLRRNVDVLVSPPDSEQPPFNTLDFRVPPESQPRLTILDNLKSFIVGNQTYEALINFQAVFRLICQVDLYETSQDIEKRVFENSIVFIPQVTLEIPTQFTPTLNSWNATTTPFILTTQSTGHGTGPNVKKLHVGAIILEKLRRVSKNGHGQSFIKHGPSKSMSKSVKVSSLPLSHQTSKFKNPVNASTLFEKTTNSDQNHQNRFSQVLGAGLEFMNHSTCVVTMGERLHLLPTLPFSVIEEIYRRGMRTPGILRISGDFTRIDELVKTFESCPSSGIDLSSEDIHTLCGLLKYYLRSLPQPLFHPLLSDIFWILCVRPDRNRNTSPQRETRTSTEFIVARYLLQLIPSRSLSLLAYVIPFLAHVPTFSENRIQDESLATMLGPAIFISRSIGFPGLGLHPRHNKTGRPAARHSSVTQSPGNSFNPNPSEKEKNEASERAAESTLWMMNNWKLLFSEVYSSGESKTEGVDSMEARNELAKSSISLHQHQGSFQDNNNKQFLPQQTSNMFTERFIRSRPSSILTYSSGLTDSRRSTVIEGSNQSPSPIHSPVGSDDLEFLTPQGIDPSGSQRDSKHAHPLSPSSPVEFPFSESKGVETSDVKQQRESSKIALKEDDKEHKFKQSPLTLFKHTAQEEKQRERRNSEKLTKLLADYIEGREEKVIQQESIIESLIEEIGRLKTAEEADEIDKRKSLWEKIKLHSNPVMNSGEQPLKKIKAFLSAIDEQHSNGISMNTTPSDNRDDLEKSENSLKLFNHTIISNQTIGIDSESELQSPSDHSSKLNEDFDQTFPKEHPEETSNFEDNDGTEHGEESDSNQLQNNNRNNNNLYRSIKPTKKYEIDTFGKLLGEEFNNRQDQLMEPVQKDHGDNNHRRGSFETQRSIDTKHLSSISSSFISGEKVEGEEFELLKDDYQLDSFDPRHLSLDTSRASMNTKHLSSISSDSSFVSGETEAFKAEIDRLRFINSKLILKLKSIESIVVAGTSDIML